MAVKTAAVNVGTSATLLNTFADTDGVFGSEVGVYNNGTVTIDVGGSDVTTGNGWPVPAGEWRSFAPKPGDALYGVAASTVEARVIATGV